MKGADQILPVFRVAAAAAIVSVGLNQPVRPRFLWEEDSDSRGGQNISHTARQRQARVGGTSVRKDAGG
jgi:hypothetical protein